MNKRGFTLVEILAVIAIIGILSLLIVPNVIESYKLSRDNAMKTQENELVDASKLFVEDYCRHSLTENKGQCDFYAFDIFGTTKKYICLKTLQEKRYIDPIVSGGQACKGYIEYESNYTNYKAYLMCGEGYITEGIDPNTINNCN